MLPHKGFSLIELLVVITVIGIVAAFALPAYTDYVRRGKITEATSTLADLRVKMEQFFQDNRNYNNPGTGVIAPPNCPVAVPTLKYFAITCPTLTATTYTVQAQALANLDISGVAYTIDQTNTKATDVTSSTTMANAGWTGNSSCWVTKKGDVC